MMSLKYTLPMGLSPVLKKTALDMSKKDERSANFETKV
jgi:hypothetical protein